MGSRLPAEEVIQQVISKQLRDYNAYYFAGALKLLAVTKRATTFT